MEVHSCGPRASRMGWNVRRKQSRHILFADCVPEFIAGNKEVKRILHKHGGLIRSIFSPVKEQARIKKRDRGQRWFLDATKDCIQIVPSPKPSNLSKAKGLPLEAPSCQPSVLYYSHSPDGGELTVCEPWMTVHRMTINATPQWSGCPRQSRLFSFPSLLHQGLLQFTPSGQSTWVSTFRSDWEGVSTLDRGRCEASTVMRIGPVRLHVASGINDQNRGR